MAKQSLYKRRIEEGLCGKCGEDRGDNKSMCDPCKEISRQRAASQRAKKKEAGLCIGCGKEPPRPGSSRCESCLASQAKNQSERVSKLKEAGLCPCGAKPKPGCVLCQPCIDKRSEHSSKLYRERKESGDKCYYCEQPRVDGLTVCEHHRQYQKQRNRDLKVEALNHYGGCRCADCGEDDVSLLQLDHVGGGGAQHRREIADKYGVSYAKGEQFYYILKREGFPQEPKLEVVCPTCNIKRHGELNEHGPTPTE